MEFSFYRIMDHHRTAHMKLIRFELCMCGWRIDRPTDRHTFGMLLFSNLLLLTYYSTYPHWLPQDLALLLLLPCPGLFMCILSSRPQVLLLMLCTTPAYHPRYEYGSEHASRMMLMACLPVWLLKRCSGCSYFCSAGDGQGSLV